jgi:hypothetical protein
MAVIKLEIKARRPFAQGQAFGSVGPYEQLDGAVYFAVDPNHAANSLIADLKLAPRDSGGRVTFSSDLCILRPVDPSLGNQRLFLDVLNRGRPTALRNINSAPDVAPDAPLDPGNGFLMRQGYTVAWCGWQHDVPNAPGRMRIRVPDAVTPQGSISGKLVFTFQPNAPIQVQFLGDRMHRPYPANNLHDPEAVLIVQEHEDAPMQVIPRRQWAFARSEGGRVVPDASHVYMASGFLSGKVYQVIYSTTGAPVVGLGLLATRDIGAFLRYGTAHQGNPCAGQVEHSYAFGVSQSARFLRLFLYLGLNRDESGRTAFDGFIPHVAGGKRGEFNQRFAQPSSQASRSTNSLFPFSDTVQTDPETGRTDGLLSRLAAQGELPRVIYINSSSEYWGGHGALLHIDVSGTHDLSPMESVRIYHLGGMQHAMGAWPLADTDPVDGHRCQQLFNCVDYRPLLRAALVNLDRWVTTGEAPPPSRYPRMADGTLVPPGRVEGTFRAIPGTAFPKPLRQFTRLDFGPDAGVPTQVPAAVGKAYPILVPAVDQDGNDVAGIRLPFITVPLATYTGWNLRHADIGGAGQIMATGGASGGTLKGSTIPFLATREEREARGDPRLSIEERYASREEYLERVERAARALMDEGYLLAEDLDEVLDQGVRLYDTFRGRVKVVQAANYDAG